MCLKDLIFLVCLLASHSYSCGFHRAIKERNQFSPSMLVKKPSCCVINIRRNSGEKKELQQQQQIAFVRSGHFESTPRNLFDMEGLFFLAHRKFSIV